MEVFVIQIVNPFFSSSASANRLLSLLLGLLSLKRDLKITIIITGGYQSRYEKEKFGVSGLLKGVKYCYVNTLIIDSIWKKRWYTYIWSYTHSLGIKYKLRKIFIDNKKRYIVWPENELTLLRVIRSFKMKDRSRLILFLELSEFLDIYKYNTGNFLQRVKGRKLQAFFEKSFFSNLSGLALMTNTLVSHYKKFPGGPRLLHLPMTVDFDRFIGNSLPLEGFCKPYIAFVGAMNDAKDGVNILIEAFGMISNEFVDLNLYLIGSWNYDTPGHQTRIRELGLEDRVIWKGEYSRDQIPAIINNAELLVLPRPDSKQARGGFPTKLGEYLATANPVCATSVGELPLYLKDNESIFFAEPGSVTSFSSAMRRVLVDYEFAREVGANGKRVAEMYFNKDIQANTLYNFLSEIYDER